MIDLLDRLVTDAKVRVERTEQAKAKPYSFAAELRSDIAADQTPASVTIAGRSGESSGQTSHALPHTLILVTTETFCTNCGERYRSPGYAILADYGENSVSVNRTMDDVRRLERHIQQAAYGDGAEKCPYPALPREHRTNTVHAPACERCF